VRVAVVGGGIGGLCLAQGLRLDGVDVTVYERDHALDARRQGYRIHLDGRAGVALHACLPPALYELVLATLGRPGTAISVVDQKLKVLHRMTGQAGGPGDPAALADRTGTDPATLSAPANRQTLREVLAAGLSSAPGDPRGDALAFGRELSGFDELPGGVRLRFADGSAADADVLVGADGVSSRVRRQYLTQARVTDTGARCLYGKTLLDDETLALVPPTVLDGFTAVIGGGVVGMASALVRFGERPESAASRLCPDVPVSPVADYLMWAVTAPGERFGVPDDQLLGLAPADLHALARKAITGWHPNLRALVDRAPVAETFVVRVSTSEPVPAWPASRVTLLGDAIHAMSPAGGSGANTALTDALVLCRELVAAARGDKPLLDAIGAYEDQMRTYGFAAVAAASRNQASMWAQRHPILARLARLTRAASPAR
jgi:2-polyprenyl-6-methoxyphenol hydroxylase-like FAD-dependent oxidoreductase